MNQVVEICGVLSGIFMGSMYIGDGYIFQVFSVIISFRDYIFLLQVKYLVFNFVKYSISIYY